MGMSINAELIYGASYDELDEVEGLDEMLDNGELDYASPHYDSPRDQWVIGVALPREMANESAMSAYISKARTEFERLTGGQPGRIIVSAHVT